MENGTGARHEEHLLVMTSLKDAPHFVHRQAFPVGIGGEKLIRSARGFEVQSHAFRQRLEVGLREAQFFQGDGIAAMALEEILLRIKSRPKKATLRGIGHRHESLRRGSRRCRRELHTAPSLRPPVRWRPMSSCLHAKAGRCGLFSSRSGLRHLSCAAIPRVRNRCATAFRPPARAQIPRRVPVEEWPFRASIRGRCRKHR